MKKKTFDFPNTVPFTWKDLAKIQAEFIANSATHREREIKASIAYDGLF